MCGRFCIAASPGELKERYGIRPDPSFTPRYNISPGQEILVITRTFIILGIVVLLSVAGVFPSYCRTR